MAELTVNSNRASWTSRQTAAQFGAIAWLRWRILLNGFRRKGGGSEMIARILIYPMLAGMALFPTVGAGILALYFTLHGKLGHLSLLLWGAFLLGIFLSLNVGRPGTTFDPNELIRFPVRLREFVAIRLFFGLLTPAIVLVTLMSLAMAIGIAIARPHLWLAALIALGVFALANMFFSRMVFAWVDRWLSTRRAREIFTVLIFVMSLGFQWINISFNPAYNHRHGAHALAQHRLLATMHLYQSAHPLLAFLPPELSTSALVAAQHGATLHFLACVLGTLLFAVFFLAVFALRMRTEFRGEVLSDVANAVGPAQSSAKRRPAIVASRPAVQPEAAALDPRPNSRISIIRTVFAKELLYVRRNTGLFYSLIVPVMMVFLFSTKYWARGHHEWVLPAAVAYALFGVVPLSYNVFGLESTGIQFYFMAPVHLRDVFIAKNLLNVLLAAVEILAVLAVLIYLTGRLDLQMVTFSLLWAAATLLSGMALGNLRSVAAPMRIEFSRAAAKQASPVSAFLGMGVLCLFAVLGAALLLLAGAFNLEWILLPSFALLLVAALVLYLFALRHVERYTLEHRESLFGTLSKT
jgi:ABC-2 type transport system permease protein